MKSITSTFLKSVYYLKKTGCIFLLLAFTTTVFGQAVESAQINDLCGPFSVFALQINHTNPGTCGSVPAFSFTWNGTPYIMPSSSVNNGMLCAQSLTGLACSGGSPTESLPATVVITSGSMAGTYEFDGSGMLPVELVKFSAAFHNEVIELSWTTASELGNEGFEIERSTDGRSFDFISFVEGNGNSTEIIDYSYQDSDIKEGQTYYYRLRQVDFNGAFSYSKLVSVNFRSEETIAGEFYPNPTVGATSIHFMSEENNDWNVKAYNLSGQLIWQSVYEMTKGENALNLNFSEFGSGLYIVKFDNNTEQIFRKLSVQ